MRSMRILLVDDHPVVRDGIRRFIETNNSLTICGETGNGNEVLPLLSETRPDVVLLDLSIEGTDGFTLISQIHALHPDVPVLVLSMHREKLYALPCLQAGARGYLMKSCITGDIENALMKVAAGGTYTSDRVKEYIIERLCTSKNRSLEVTGILSNREYQIFRLLGDGLKTATISEKLYCSTKTVETHIYRIRQKLNLATMSDVTAMARLSVNPP